MKASLVPTVTGYRYRTIFISASHLGTKGCRSDFLADFLRRTSSEQLFLVGDIIDGWRLHKSWYWDANHDEVLRLVMKKARNGTRITYIPGNHDEMLRGWLPVGMGFAGIQLCKDAAHVTADGRRLLVMHGDEFDSVARYAKFLALLGDWAYSVALVANRRFNAVCRRLGHPYWSLSAWLKRQVRGACKAIDLFETALAEEARRRGLRPYPPGRDAGDGGVPYLNDGDWIESCAALVEHFNGRLELLDWAAIDHLSFFEPRRSVVAAA